MNGEFTTLNANDFEKAITNSTTITIDVRPAEDFAEEHIPNAINIDMSYPDFETRVSSRKKTIAVYCKNGVRSKMAAVILSNKGLNVVYLKGGLTEWKKAGKKTEC